MRINPFSAAPRTPPKPEPAEVPKPRDLSVVLPQPHFLSPKTFESAALPPVGIVTSDGVLAFALTRGALSVHVKRTHRRIDGTQIRCYASFRDEASFMAWLDADDLRFSYALAFQQVRRSFAQLLSHGCARESIAP